MFDIFEKQPARSHCAESKKSAERWGQRDDGGRGDQMLRALKTILRALALT